MKRLAEIVSAQAIDQQEKLDYTNGDGQEQLPGVDEVETES